MCDSHLSFEFLFFIDDSQIFLNMTVIWLPSLFLFCCIQNNEEFTFSFKHKIPLKNTKKTISNKMNCEIDDATDIRLTLEFRLIKNHKINWNWLYVHDVHSIFIFCGVKNIHLNIIVYQVKIHLINTNWLMCQLMLDGHLQCNHLKLN